MIYSVGLLKIHSEPATLLLRRVGVRLLVVREQVTPGKMTAYSLKNIASVNQHCGVTATPAEEGKTDGPVKSLLHHCMHVCTPRARVHTYIHLLVRLQTRLASQIPRFDDRDVKY